MSALVVLAFGLKDNMMYHQYNLVYCMALYFWCFDRLKKRKRQGSQGVFKVFGEQEKPSHNSVSLAGRGVRCHLAKPTTGIPKKA
jgi:hypothetical protein